MRALVLKDRSRRTQQRLLAIPSEDTRAVTFEMDNSLVDHLKTQAAIYGTSVLQYLRQLIAQDVRRVGPGGSVQS